MVIKAYFYSFWLKEGVEVWDKLIVKGEFSQI